MDVSVIIVTYNTLQMTKECIDSVIDKTCDVSYEIILVDNASTDGSKEFFQNYKGIKYIYNDTNLGFGKANNKGIKKAQGEYLFFLNSDTYLLNDAISYFYNFCKTHTQEKMGAIGTILFSPSGQIVHSFAKFPTIRSIISDFYIYPFYKLFGKQYKRYDTTKSDCSKPYFQVDYVTGADLFVKRNIIELLGGFDPDFFMYYEEVEMQHRWTKNGYKSYIIKNPKIVHLEGYTSKEGNSNKFSERKFFWGLESAKLYFRKCYPGIYYYLCRISMLSQFLPVFRGKFNIRQICQMAKILLSK